MKTLSQIKFLFLLLLQLAITPLVFSQNIAINTSGNLPDTSAMLDISSSTTGFLMPRMTTTQMNAIILPATGLAIFNTSLNALEINTGTASTPSWLPLLNSKTGWSSTGNSGSNSAVNFIGVTDNHPLKFKVNNVQAGYIDSSGGNALTSFGYQAGITNTTGTKNTFIGAGADAAAATLTNATAIGANAIVSASNSLILGGTGANAVNVGIGTTSPSATFDDSGTFKMGQKGTVNKNIISFAGTLSSTAIPAGTASVSSSGVVLLTVSVLTTIGTPVFAAGSTDITVTIPAAYQPTSAQATIQVTPTFDLPAGVSIASARLSATNTVKIRFVNANTTAATLSGTGVYLTISEF